MSTAHTTDMPAPAAQPGTAATTGTAHVAMAVTMPWNASASVADVRAAVLGARERPHIAARAEARALADHQRGADLGRIGAVQRFGDQRQRLVVEGAVPPARHAQPQHPALADDRVTHASSSLTLVGRVRCTAAPMGARKLAHARPRSFGSTSSANCVRNRSWSWPGPWKTRWLRPAST